MIATDDQESVLKPIGDLAQAIEAMTMPQYVAFILHCSKLSAAAQVQSEPIKIGFND